jgi:hypothetical protein
MVEERYSLAHDDIWSRVISLYESDTKQRRFVVPVPRLGKFIMYVFLKQKYLFLKIIGSGILHK